MPDVPVKAAAETKRSNVLFILTDDRAWGDAHFAGHPYLQSRPPSTGCPQAVKTLPGCSV